MKDAMHSGEPVVVLNQDDVQKGRRRKTFHCAVCSKRIWFDSVRMTEPEGVPEPRLSWLLCKECHGALLLEMRRSPVRSPLRLRIAIGIIASERWPQAYPTHFHEYISDRRWIIFMAICFFIAMIFHLALIVALPLLSK